MARNLYLRGAVWYFNFYLQGQRFQGRIGALSKTVAKERLTKIRAEAIEGKHLPGKVKDELFPGVLEQYMAHCKDYQRPKTYRNNLYRVKALNSEFGLLRLSHITPFRIEKFKQRRKAEGCAPATINRELAMVRHLFNKAIDWGYARVNPFQRVKLFRENNERSRYLSEEEKSRYLQACNPHFRNLVTAARHTGCRASELISLTWPCIDFGLNQLVVKACYAKSGQTRTIPITETLRELLLRLKGQAPHGIPYVFLNRHGQPYRGYRTAHEVACRKVGIEDFNFHDWRHDFASNLAMAGESLVTIRDLMGHRDIKMTLRYSHISEDHKRKAVSVLDRIEEKVTTILTTARREKIPSISGKLLKN